MTPFTTLTSPATPFFRDGVATDVIYAGPRADIDTGIVEKNIFRHFRYDEAGRARPESLFDKPPFDQSAILIVGRGFGRGRSPDVAAKALSALGIVCLIGVSFEPDFEEQAGVHGVLTLTLDYEAVYTLIEEAAAGDAMTVDLSAQKIITCHGNRIGFAANPEVRAALLADATKLSLARSKTAAKKHRKKVSHNRHLLYAASA